MADMTDEEEERVEPQPHVAANIPAIAALIGKNGLVAKAEEKGTKARSDLGNLYQKIQNDYHGNTRAVKLVRTLESGTIDAAYDFMRTFVPLAQHFGLIPEDDLVDMAGREDDEIVVPPKAAAAPASEDAQPGKDEGVIDFGARRQRRPSAIDQARQHLEGGTKAEPGADNDEGHDNQAAAE